MCGFPTLLHPVKPRPFDYQRVTSLAEAYALLSEHGDSAKVVAGGQSLVPMMNLRLVSPALLLDIGALDELRGVTLNGDMLRIGPLVRHCDIASDDLIARHAPLLAKAVGHVAHLAVRNRGTFGGSLAQADPAGDWPALALAFGATIHATNAKGPRRIAVDKFFTNLFTTALEQGDVLTHVAFPRLEAGASRFGFVSA